MTGFVFSFYLLFRWGVMHRVLLVVGWCWVLYSSGFFCVSSHHLVLPRVSCLVVWGLGVSAPPPKAQGLIYWLLLVVVVSINCMNRTDVLQDPLQEDIEKDQNPVLPASEVHRSGLFGGTGHFTGPWLCKRLA